MTRYMRGCILWTAAVSGADYAERGSSRTFRSVRVKRIQRMIALVRIKGGDDTTTRTAGLRLRVSR